MGTAPPVQYRMGGATKQMTEINNTATRIVASTSTATSGGRTGTKPIGLDKLGSYYPGIWINQGQIGQGKKRVRHTQVIAIPFQIHRMMRD